MRAGDFCEFLGRLRSLLDEIGQPKLRGRVDRLRNPVASEELQQLDMRRSLSRLSRHLAIAMISEEGPGVRANETSPNPDDASQSR